MPGLFTDNKEISFTKITGKDKHHAFYQLPGFRVWTLEAYMAYLVICMMLENLIIILNI